MENTATSSNFTFFTDHFMKIKFDSFSRAIFLALTVALSSNAYGQPLMMAKLQGEFKENLSPDVKVSGAVLVGVSASGGFNGADLRKMIIYSQPRLEKICLRVSTSDGVYSAQNEYLLPPSSADKVPVLLPYEASRHLTNLAEYPDQSVAVKATVGSCDATSDERVVLPVHRSGQVEDNKFVLYVNSMGATDLYVSAGNLNGVCKPIENRHSNFDHICITPDLDINKAPGGNIVTLERERYGRELPSVKVLLNRNAMVHE